MNPALVLASASPRRREILRALGFAFELVDPAVDESPIDGAKLNVQPVILGETDTMRLPLLLNRAEKSRTRFVLGGDSG